MTFPEVRNWNLVVAKPNEAGEPDFFIGDKPEAVVDQPGIVEGAWYWRVDDGHSAETPGSIATTMNNATRNGSTFGIVRFPANSAGKLDAASTGAHKETGHQGDAAMHATDTIDYEVVLSGKIDLELPGGKKHTLVPGDLLVLAGVPHAWKNPYDEDCTFLAVTVGYNS
ncbi:cupin domain-containing protein [Arthrobacter nitrophenolicus]|uniref:Mannose-6-phosphate isomerase-like protein (Cupin superfamily) n=1 Tax=Arthrobacter nitrophenolicus TaxID=683150 RepID=A0ACC6TL82_9MICC